MMPLLSSMASLMWAYPAGRRIHPAGVGYFSWRQFFCSMQTLVIVT